MSGQASALTCPSCGSLLQLPDGETGGRCASCGSSVRLPEGIRRFALPAVIDGTEALRQVRHELESPNVRRGIANTAKVQPPQLYYVPYWHVSAQVSGFAFGVEPQWREDEVPTLVSQDSSEDWGVMTTKRTVRTRIGWRAAKKEIRFLGTVNISGADLETLGLPSFSDRAQMSVTGMEIQHTGLPEGVEALDRDLVKEGVLVDPSVSLSSAYAQAEKVFLRLVEGSSRGLDERWSYAVTVGRRASMIYYPIWVVSFEYGGRLYSVVVDGRNGTVLSGRFPGRRQDRHLIASGLAFAWASVIPYAVHTLAILTGASPGLQTHCPLVFAVIVFVVAAGTGKLLGILDGVERRGSDYVI
jgi:LSD1 subclass zinc finger protein